MKKEESPNFLPQDERQRANEVLQKQAQQSDAEMKLVIQQMEQKDMKNAGKKESFWQKRKRVKQEKKDAKLRRKGETGSVKKGMNTDLPKNTSLKEPKPELFSDIIATKQETKPVFTATKADQKAPVTKPEQPKAPKMVEPNKVKSVEVKPVEPLAKKIEVKTSAPKPISQQPTIPASPKQEIRAPKGSKKMHEPEKNGTDFDGPSVNLVPDTMMPQSGGPNWILGLVILVITIAILVIVGGIGASRVKKAEAQVLEKKNRITQIDKLITEFNSGKVAAQSLQEQFDSVEGLIENHLYWTPLLKKLEENTLSDVYYIAINADQATQVVSLSAIAKNYAAAARQIRSFQLAPNFVSKVTVGEVRVENQPEAELPVPIVTFDLQLELKDGVLTFVSPDSSN